MEFEVALPLQPDLGVVGKSHGYLKTNGGYYERLAGFTHILNRFDTLFYSPGSIFFLIIILW